MMKGIKITQVVLATFLVVLAILICVQDVSAQGDYAPDQLIIKYKKGANSANVKSRMAEKGVSALKKIPELRLEVLEVAPEELEDIQNSLSQDPDVEYVEKNYYYEPLAIPNDTLFNDQLYFDVIQALQAWDIETGNPDVVIAFVDTGLDVTHEDLQGGKILPGCNTSGIAFDHITCNPDITDFVAHGTGVAGTAAVDTNNNVGVAGICWGCSILPVKVFTDAGSTTLSDIIEGLLFAVNYALNNPTKKVIINMSLGRICGGPTQAEQDAINLAWDNGILLVAARGNSGDYTPLCPAAAQNVIAVSGTTLDDIRWPTSSWNNVDLAAPAVSIYNIAPGALFDPPYIPTWGGTSFSSAIVSGVAGLVWSANMSMNNWQLDQILRNTADDLGKTAYFGASRINANAAVIQAPNPPIQPTPTPSPTPVPTPDPNKLLMSNIQPPNLSTDKYSVFISNAIPGKGVLLKYSPNPGQSVIPNGACKGETLDLADPAKIGRGRSDANGRVTIEFRAPKSYIPGTRLPFQAHMANGKVCRTGNVKGKTLN